MLSRLRNRTRDDEGASAVEYGLLVAAIAAVVVVVVFALGGLVNNVFKSTCNEIGTAGAPAGGVTVPADCAPPVVPAP